MKRKRRPHLTITKREFETFRSFNATFRHTRDKNDGTKGKHSSCTQESEDTTSSQNHAAITNRNRNDISKFTGTILKMRDACSASSSSVYSTRESKPQMRGPRSGQLLKQLYHKIYQIHPLCCAFQRALAFHKDS